jgi:hypothetical protein
LRETNPPKINNRFTYSPASKDDARTPLFWADMADFLRLEYERTASNDYVARFEKRLVHIVKENRNRP